MSEDQSKEEQETPEAEKVELDEKQLDQAAGGSARTKGESSQKFGGIIRKKTGGDDTSLVLGKGPVPD